MPTEKPRFTVTVSDDMKRRIEDYQFSNRMRNQNQAVSQLIARCQHQRKTGNNPGFSFYFNVFSLNDIHVF